MEAYFSRFIILVLVLVCFLITSPVDCLSASKCSPSGGTIIGTVYYPEYCPSNDDHYGVWSSYDIKCNNNGYVEEIGYTGGAASKSKNSIAGLWQNYGRVFKNSSKSHIIFVFSSFGSTSAYTIEEKTVNQFAANGIFDNIFSVLIPEEISYDSDNDGYLSCDDCVDNDPLVNPNASEICNDGLDNDCNTYADCADSSCSSDPACISTDPVSEDFPVTPCPLIK